MLKYLRPKSCKPMEGTAFGDRRGTLDLMADVLRSLSETALGRTNIGHRTNLDSRGTAKYLKLLVELQMADAYGEQRSKFMITPRGREFLMKYDQLIGMTRDVLSDNGIRST